MAGYACVFEKAGPESAKAIGAVIRGMLELWKQHRLMPVPVLPIVPGPIDPDLVKSTEIIGRMLGRQNPAGQAQVNEMLLVWQEYREGLLVRRA